MLSSTPMGKSSTTVATSAPVIATAGWSLISSATAMHTTKHARLPSKLFREKSLIRPHCLPINAAHRSPRVRKQRHTIANVLSKKSTQRKDPIRKYVAPVGPPFCSCERSIGEKIRRNVARTDGTRTLSSSAPRARATSPPTPMMAKSRDVKRYRIGTTNPKRWILLRVNSRAMISPPTFTLYCQTMKPWQELYQLTRHPINTSIRGKSGHGTAPFAMQILPGGAEFAHTNKGENGKSTHISRR